MTTVEIAAPTAIICASNQSLKSVLREGGRQAGITSSMLLDKTSEATRALKEQPIAWLLVDYQIPTEDLARILVAAQGTTAFNTRPIYLVASDFQPKLVDFALEYNVSKIRFGEIHASGIEKDLKEMSALFAKKSPVANAIATAHKFIESRKLSDASATFLGLLEQFPSDTTVMVEYVDFLIFSNDLPRAKQYIEQALLLEPNDIRIQHLQARFYMRSKNFDEGIRLLESINAKNPWSPMRLIELGDALLATAKFTEARERFDKALVLNPDSEAAKAGRAKSAMLGGNVQEGLDLLKDLGSPRQMASTLNAAAVFASRTERHDDARNLYERGIQLLIQDGPSASRLWYNLGILEHRDGKLTQALKCFRNSIGTDATFKDAKHNYDILKQLVDSEKGKKSATTKRTTNEMKTIHIPDTKDDLLEESITVPPTAAASVSRDLDDSPAPSIPSKKT